MADKGFHLKVLIPTDDGLTISEKGVEGAMYYLTYNVSNRSYQLAEKVRCINLFNNQFDWEILIDYCNTHLIDVIVSTNINNLIKEIKIKIVKPTEIGTFLNQLIDIVDSGKEI